MAQFNVNLAFNADTGKAKTQIQELQSLLSKIAYTGTTAGTDKLQSDLHQASEAAKALQFHLNNAFNASTGNFDLSLLDRSLKTSGTNIQKLSMDLLSIGPAGQQAFMKLAQSISLADQPMLRISRRMQEFAVTMKNTVKWQLSSSMLHGFMSAVQSAYGYAQDLNKSLNDIRIVTGYSSDKMAEFAEQANKAAKALSTTTTDYTNASLIYFQQGLSDAEVAARTDITIKMANAVGQSAEVISEQLTAVWNNFDDGSKSLEYYADVMTALGAATASSSDEIAEGLSKFSAVASTVGLSYEYATAALATLTSNTRESADVVGNALKTLFARIQGLQLGETLDDGTNLNKYSQALEKVGISIYDANGGLKSMDATLDEMAAKWNTLTGVQQVALAQTVAGVRQYNQLIALMNNWNNGDNDSMMANLSTIEGSDGALQEQADIYAQSWEAAEKRVKAAAEGIYQSLLDDNFFISLTNGFANLLGGIDAFIDGAGGVKTVLLGIGGIVMSMFANKIPQALDTLKYNLRFVTNSVQDTYKDIQNKMDSATKMAFEGFESNGQKVAPIKQDSSLGYQIQAANELTAARSKLAVVSDKMSNSEKQYYDTQLNIIQSAQNEVIAIKKKNEALQESINLQKQNLQKSDTNVSVDKAARDSVQSIAQLRLSYENEIAQMQESINYVENLIQNNSTPTSTQYEEYDAATEQIQNYQLLASTIKDFHGVVQDAAAGMQNFHNSIGGDLLEQITGPNFDEKSSKVIKFPNELLASFERLSSQIEGDKALDLTDKMNVDVVHQELKTLESSIDPAIRKASGLQNAFDKVFNATEPKELQAAFKQLEQAMENCEIQGKDFKKVLEGLYGKSVDSLIKDINLLKQGEQDAAQQAGVLKKLLNEFNPQHVVRTSEALGALGGIASNSVFIISSLISAIKNINNPDLSGWERFSSLISAIGMGIPQVLGLLQNVATLRAFSAQLIEKENAALTKQAILNSLNSAEFNSAYKSRVKNIQALLLSLSAENKEKLAGVLATAALAKSEDTLDDQKRQALITQIMSITGCNAEIAAKLLEAAVNKKVEATLWGIAKARIAAMPTSVKIILAVVAALAALVLIGDALTTSQKEANEAIAEATTKYEEEADKLKGLEDELSNIKDRIDELNSQDTLSIVDQAELADLERRKALLEQQVALQAELTKDAQREQAKTISENWDTANTLTRPPVESTKVTESYFDRSAGGGNYGEWVDRVETLDQYAKRIGYDLETGLFGENSELSTEERAAAIEYIKNWQAEEEQARAKWRAENAEQYQANEDNYSAMIAADQSGVYNLSDEEKTKMQADLEWQRKAMFGDDYDDIFMKPLMNAMSDLNVTKDAQGNYSASATVSQDVLDARGLNQDQFNAYLSERMNANPEAMSQLMAIEDFDFSKLSGDQLFLLLDNLGELEHFDGSSMEELLNYINGITGIKAPKFDANAWKTDYAAVKEIVDGLNTGDVISAEDYALLGEEYQKYFTVQADGTAILTGKAEELKAAVQSIEVGKLIGSIQQTQGNMNDFSHNTNENGEVELDNRYMSTDAARGALDSHNAGWSYRDQDLTDYTSLVNEHYGTSFDTSSAEGWEQAIAYVEQQNALLEEQQALLAGTAASQDQLNQYLQQGLITQEQYNQNFAGATIKEAKDLGIDVDELMEYAEYLQEVEGMTEELALKAALAQKKQGKAVEDLTDNYEDYAKVLKKAKLDPTIKGTEEYSKAIMGLRKDLSLLTGLSEDTFDEDFINSPEVQKALEDVANGVDGAIERVQALAAMDILKDREQFIIKAGLEVDQEQFSALTNQIAELNNQDIEVGTRINDAPALDQLANLVNASGMTAAQMQEFFNALGWEPEIEWVEADADTVANMKSLGYQEYGVLNEDGSMSIHSVPLDGNMSQHSGQKIMIPKIKTSGEGGGYTKIDPPGGGGGSSNKGGGGGGGSKKHAEKKDTGDRTRYHTLQNQLEDLQDAYDNISNAADRAFGKNKLDLMDKQGAALDNLINKQKEYVDALSADVPVDKAVMDAYYNKVIGGPAMEFDKDGNISNYDDIEAAMHAKYNEMADRYTDDSEEWQAFEKQYEQMEKYIEDYEQYYDDLRDAEAAYQDLINQRIDLQLQKVQYKVELELDVENDEMELIQYQLSLIEDDAFKSAEAITLLTKQAESLYDQIQVNKQGLNDTLALSLDAAEIASVMSGDLSVLKDKSFTEDQIGAIRDYRDSLISLNEEFNEVRKSIEEQVMETFDAWQEKLERGSDALEHYGSILESYQNIVDIVGADTLGISSKFMADLSQAKVSNSIDQLEAAKSSYEAVAAAQKEAQEALAAAQAAEDDASISMWEETLITLNEGAQAASEELMAAWEEALSGIVEAFDMAVDRAVQDFNDAIYSLGGVEGLLDAFQNAQETSDLMLEDYQQIYELSKLSRDINNSIDDTDSLAGKQKLKKLLGEINKLQEEGVEMSQYDLEYLQAEYNLRLAEIELEEAQNAKNTVRLQKDNEGNWSYVYTQNTDAVDAAQQKYEDALYSMQDLSSNYIDEMSEQLISTSQEMAEALAALRVEDFASIDEYYAEVERVQAQYQEEIAMQESELQKAIDNNKELYEQDWTNYHNATGYKISDTENFVTSFKDSLLGTLLDSESDTANFASILGQATASLTTNLMEAAATYYQNLDSAMEAAGTTTEGFAEDTQANIEAIVAASESGAAAVDAMATEMTQAFDAVADSVTSWQETYGIAMQAVMDSNVKVIESFNAMLSALAIDEGSVTVKYDIASAPEADPEQFDTGGYTGEWGNKGKIAVVHEKELILNEDDTTNFLSAIQVTRAMLETIDLNAKQASLGMGNLIASTVKDEAVQTLEQEVHITAEFPNVSDHNEVEEALKNLMNTASQYANRK